MGLGGKRVSCCLLQTRRGEASSRARLEREGRCSRNRQAEQVRNGVGVGKKKGRQAEGGKAQDGRFDGGGDSNPVQVKTVGRYHTGTEHCCCSALCCCKLQVAVRKAGRPREVRLLLPAGSAGSAASARL